MKKVIASLALMASATSAHALVGPGGPPNRPAPTPRTICLGVWEDDLGNKFASDCDSAARNVQFGLEIKENGCAEGQAAMKTTRVVVRSCPTFVQL